MRVWMGVVWRRGRALVLIRVRMISFVRALGRLRGRASVGAWRSGPGGRSIQDETRRRRRVRTTVTSGNLQ
ncbi:hypothetical protein B0H13DRAFT_2012894 [Mycena leptocephala]|nr:hypothetical protein B0H13DRAFT_2012894 [Mycena leptocephala]